MLNRRELLGAASVLALSPGAAWAQAKNAADVAVEAAKKYAGTEISIVWEAGLQSLDPLNYSGPKWEKLTGIKVKVVEVPTDQMFTKIMQDFRSGAGAYDALNVIPSWMPDLVRAGALENLDPLVDKFGYRDELKDIAPAYRDNQMTVGGKIYGFPDDGDVMILYYRKDIFEDPKMMEEFKAKHGYDLAPPKNWKQFAEIGQFITDKMAPKTYGAGFFRTAPYPPIHVPGTFPHGGRQVLRCRHHEVDGQQRRGRQGFQGHAWRKTSSCRQAWNNGTSSIILPTSCRAQPP